LPSIQKDAIPFLYPYYREILGLDEAAAAVYQAQYNLTRNCQATINFGGILLLTFCLSVVVAIVLQLQPAPLPPFGIWV
jgi:hypothetical protein